jgi:hypothetical protein
VWPLSLPIKPPRDTSAVLMRHAPQQGAVNLIFKARSSTLTPSASGCRLAAGALN